MRINFTRHIRIPRLAALALLALCLVQTQIRAQGMTEYILIAPSVGFAGNQTLRFTLLNPNEPDSQGGREPVRAKVKLYDASGNVIAESDEVRIPAGEFRSFDFKRSDIPLAGEPGTGRLQIKGTWTMTVQDAAAQIDGFLASVEIVDNKTGKTILIGTPVLAAQKVRRDD